MEKRLAYLAIALVFAAGFFIGLQVQRHRPGPVVTQVQKDTLWIHDTLRIQQPAPKAKTVHDTTYLAVTDTVRLRDTLFVPIPRETAYYKEEDYEAWVTGYKASLDSLHIFQKVGVVEVPVYKTITKHARWGIGVQAGATYLPNTGVTPYVGLGVSYNLFTF